MYRTWVKVQYEFRQFWIIVSINGMYHKINTYLIKTKKHNYFNEKYDYIIRLMVDYYYIKISNKLYDIKLVINSMQYVSVFWR
jgi:hypothetical protein